MVDAVAAAAVEEQEPVAPLGSARPAPHPLLARRPQYMEEHSCCSVLVARFANTSAMQQLPAERQFEELHRRVYLEVDRIFAEQEVFKLYGGAEGFMVCTNVSEPDEQHAASLLQAALHLQQAAAEIRLPGPGGTSAPLQLVMALISGPAASGLMGRTSLTYQLAGEKVAVARELSRFQRMPLMVTCSTYDLLPTDVQDSLYGVGRVQLRCLSGQERDVAIYTQAQFGHIPLLQPHAQPAPRMLGVPGAGGQQAHAWQAARVGGQEEGEALEEPAGGGDRPPAYKDVHEDCSVLVGSIANIELLHSLPPAEQFKWLHRLYLVVDATLEAGGRRNQGGRLRVYKLYGGAEGFMVCANVSEPDEQHATTLYKLARDLHTVVQHHVKLPGPDGQPVPVQLTMTLASGPAASGLLGTTSLTYQIVGWPAALACELNLHQRVPLLVTESAYLELPDEVQELCGPRCVVECPDGQRAAVYSLPGAAGLPLRDPVAPEDAAAGAQRPEPEAPASPKGAGTTCAALAAQRRLADQDALSETVAAQLAADRSAAGPSTPTGSQSPVVAPLAPGAGPAAAEQRMAAARAAVQPGGRAGKQAEGAAAANWAAGRHAMDAVLRFADPEAEADFARHAATRPVEPGASFVLAALGLLCLLALPSTWQDPALPLLLAAHGLPLLAAALCCWLEVSDTWWWYEGLWCVQRALAVEALRQGARLGGHGAFPLPAWAASLAALSVQAALVLPVRFHQHLLASLLTVAMVLTCGITLTPGAWAALVAGEAAVALVAGWRERRARHRFVQAQPSRAFSEVFAILARAG